MAIVTIKWDTNQLSCSGKWNIFRFYDLLQSWISRLNFNVVIIFFFYICVDLLQLTSVWSINIICLAEAYLTLYCRSAISPRVSCEG